MIAKNEDKIKKQEVKMNIDVIHVVIQFIFTHLKKKYYVNFVIDT